MIVISATQRPQDHPWFEISEQDARVSVSLFGPDPQAAVPLQDKPAVAGNVGPQMFRPRIKIGVRREHAYEPLTNPTTSTSPSGWLHTPASEPP